MSYRVTVESRGSRRVVLLLHRLQVAEPLTDANAAALAVALVRASDTVRETVLSEIAESMGRSEARNHPYRGLSAAEQVWSVQSGFSDAFLAEREAVKAELEGERG